MVLFLWGFFFSCKRTHSLWELVPEKFASDHHSIGERKSSPPSLPSLCLAMLHLCSSHLGPDYHDHEASRGLYSYLCPVGHLG